MILLAITILMLLLILLRVPVAIAILSSAILGLVILTGFGGAVSVLQTVPYSAVASNALTAIPLFILMAQFILHSGALKGLFDAVRVIIGRVRGGTAYAAIGAGAVFASISGSSTASAATLANTANDQMVEQGYDPRLSAGVIAASGTLAAMIPPSVLLVFYAITAETSVGKTLMAGLLPGLLVAVSIMITVMLTIRLRSGAAPKGQATSWSEKARSLVKVAPILLIFLLVMGLVFLGITTASEAAAAGALGGLVLLIASGNFSLDTVKGSFYKTASSSVMVLTIVLAAYIFGHFVVETEVTPKLIQGISNLPAAPWVIVAAIAIIYLFLGFFMDQMAIIALTVPITLPVVQALGFDPIWFGIVVILMAEIGLISPPLGLNVFVVAKAAKLPVESVFAGSLPFTVSILAVVVLVFVFPPLALFLPSLM